jgi:hypothetical protein
MMMIMILDDSEAALSLVKLTSSFPNEVTFIKSKNNCGSRHHEQRVGYRHPPSHGSCVSDAVDISHLFESKDTRQYTHRPWHSNSWAIFKHIHFIFQSRRGHRQQQFCLQLEITVTAPLKTDVLFNEKSNMITSTPNLCKKRATYPTVVCRTQSLGFCTPHNLQNLFLTHTNLLSAKPFSKILGNVSIHVYHAKFCM